MFERSTGRARIVVVQAQEEARLLGHAQIGTEHLLLGLLREEDGIAAGVLAGPGVKLDETRTAGLVPLGSAFRLVFKRRSRP